MIKKYNSFFVLILITLLLKLFDFNYNYINEYDMFPNTNHKEYLVKLF